jgi:acyl carrier protein
MESIEAQIERHIRSLDQSTPAIDWDRPLLDDGIVVSIHILSIVNFFEERFGIRIDPFEISPESFRTIRTMADFVRSKSPPIRDGLEPA